jgi:hypothetical protein
MQLYPCPQTESLTTCAIEKKWSVADENRMYWGQSLRASPNGRLLVREDRLRTTILRARDGGLRWPSLERNLDARWEKRLEADGDGRLTLFDVRSSSTLFTVEAPAPPEGAHPHAYSWTVAHMSADGAHILALDCFEISQTLLRVIDLEAGGAAKTSWLEIECEPHWTPSPSPILLEDTVHGTLLVLSADGEIFKVDPDRGVVQSRAEVMGPRSGMTIGLPSAVTPFNAESGGVLSAALSGDGSALVLSGLDGMLHIVDPDTLESRDPGVEIGKVYANGDTYMPSIESPVAISPDGQTLAFLDPMGRVALRRMSDGGEIATLDGPFPGATADPSAGFPGAPMAILLSNERVTVSYQAGFASWGCVETVSSCGNHVPLSVTIVGPTSLMMEEAFDEAAFSVNVSGGDGGPVVRRLLGQPSDTNWPASLSSSMKVDVYHPGPVDLSAIVDDGVQTATTSIRVDL